MQEEKKEGNKEEIRGNEKEKPPNMPTHHVKPQTNPVDENVEIVALFSNEEIFEEKEEKIDAHQKEESPPPKQNPTSMKKTITQSRMKSTRGHK